MTFAEQIKMKGKYRSLRWALMLGIGVGAASDRAHAADVRASDGKPLPGREKLSQDPYIGTSGEGRRPTVDETAGLTGRAGGSGTVDSSDIKDAEAAVKTVYQDISTGVRDPIKLGIGEGSVSAAIPIGASYFVPLTQWRFRPEDADIKIGKFYLDFRHLYGSILFSDNDRLTHDHRESGVIAIIGLGVTAMFEATEQLTLSLGGDFAYLPFQNKAGFGNTWNMLSGSITPVALAQFKYDIPAGNTDIQLYDTLMVRDGGIRDGVALDLFSDNADAIDRAGRYYYRVPYNQQDFRRSDHLTQYYIRNRVGASVSRLVPTETRLTAGAYHEDTWFQGFGDVRDQVRDVIYVSAKSERDNLRFKPFADYRFIHGLYYHKGWDQIGYAGLEGPITRQLDFLGEVGRYQSDNRFSSSAEEGHHEWLLWTARLKHTIGPDTYQTVEYARQLTDPENLLRTGVYYRFHHLLARDLTVDLAMDYSKFEDLDQSQTGNTRWRGGTMFTYQMTSRLDARLSGFIERQEYNSTPDGSRDIYTGRLEVNLKHSKTLTSSLFYQYQQREAESAVHSYYENLIVYTIIKRL